MALTPSVSLGTGDGFFKYLMDNTLNIKKEVSQQLKRVGSIIENVSDCSNDSYLKIKDTLCPPTELGLIIQGLTTRLVTNEDIPSLAKVILSPEFNSLKSDLAKIVAKLENRQLKTLLKSVFRDIQDTNLLIPRLNGLLQLQKIESLLGFTPLEEAKRVSKFVEGEYQAVSEEKKQTYLRTAKIYITSMIEWVIENFKMAFALNDIGGEVDDPAQATMRVMMLFSLWGSLNAWLLSLSTMLGSAVLTAAVVSCGLFVGAAALVFYQRWLKPIPEHCAPFENYTSAEAKGEWTDNIATLKSKIQEVIDALMANSESTWLQPVLIGAPGTGKTTIMRGVAARINSGDVPERLKGAKMFVGNCADLMPENTSKVNKNRSVDNLTKFTNILRPFKWKVVLGLDELHTLAMNHSNLIEKIKTTFSPGPSGFPYCIGATTPAEFKRYLASNPAFVRRIKIIPVDPTDKETTILILETMALQEADDLDIEHDVCETVYNLCEKHFPDMAQPAMAKTILAKAFSEARNVKNHELEKLLQGKQNEKASLMHVFQRSKDVNTQTEKGKAYVASIDKLDAAIKFLENSIQKEQNIYAKLASLKRQRNELKKEIYGMAIKIKQGQASEDFIKTFALKQNYLLPSLDQSICLLQKTHSCGIVDKKLIQKIIFKEVEDREKSKMVVDPSLVTALNEAKRNLVEAAKKNVNSKSKPSDVAELLRFEATVNILQKAMHSQENH